MPSAKVRATCGPLPSGASSTTTRSGPGRCQMPGSWSRGYAVAVTDHSRPASSKAAIAGFGKPLSSLATSSTVKPSGTVKAACWAAAVRAAASSALPLFKPSAFTLAGSAFNFGPSVARSPSSSRATTR